MERLFNRILEVIGRNNSCVLATIVSSRGSSPRKVGARMAVFKDGSIEGTIGGGALEKLVIRDALEVLKKKMPVLKEYPLNKESGLQVCGGKVSIFIEALEPFKKLVIMGGGHIGLSLSLLAKLLGLSVTVVDNRRDFADKRRFPHADEVIYAPYAKAFKRVGIDRNTFIVIVTHGHAHDTESLREALKTGAGYIGMIGSKAKIRLVFGQLKKEGVSEDRLRKVFTPVGLEIGAETPEEIAVSIAAELIKVYRAKEV